MTRQLRSDDPLWVQAWGTYVAMTPFVVAITVVQSGWEQGLGFLAASCGVGLLWAGLIRRWERAPR